MLGSTTVTMERRQRVVVILLALMVSALSAIIETLGSALRDQPSPYQVVWVRYAVHVAFLLIVFGPRHRARLVRTTHLLPQLARGLTMLGMPVCFILAARALPADDVWSIGWLAPLVAMALAAVLLGEKTSWPVWLASLVAFAGALLIQRRAPFALDPAAGASFGMALCFALYLFTSRALRDENIIASLFYTAVAVLVPLTAALPAARSTALWASLTMRNGAIMALIGLSGLLLLFGLDRATEKAPVALGAPFLLSTPLWLIIVREVHLRSTLQPSVLAGAALTSLALLSLLVYQLRAASPAAASATPGPAVELS